MKELCVDRGRETGHLLAQRSRLECNENKLNVWILLIIIVRHNESWMRSGIERSSRTRKYVPIRSARTQLNIVSQALLPFYYAERR